MLKEKEIERGQPRKVDKTILKEKEIERGQQREVDKTMKNEKEIERMQKEIERKEKEIERKEKEIERGQPGEVRMRPQPRIGGGFSFISLIVAVAMVAVGYMYR